MIQMPLIDDSNQLLDRELMAEIASDYTQNNGHIIDKNGNTWIRWRVDGLDAWWRLFEEIIGQANGQKTRPILHVMKKNICYLKELLRQQDFSKLQRLTSWSKKMESKWMGQSKLQKNAILQ